MQKIILKITQEDSSLITDLPYQCFILAENLSSHFKNEVSLKAKELKKLVLGLSVSDCLAYNLDGILLDLSKSENIPADYKKQTKDLKNKFIGIICRNRRHEAMIASECEPDFIVFKAWCDGIEKIKDLSSWYNEMFLIQCAVMPMENLDYASFKTDFAVLSDEFLKQQKTD